MKYLTLDWWNGIQEDTNNNDPFELYEKYYQSIEEQLPTAFIQLHSEVYLHDGNLKSIKFTSCNSELQIIIDADDGNGNLRKITLDYTGVTQYISHSDQEKGLPGPLGYGDLGYHEVELLENCLEHRVLFSSGIEIQVQFNDLQLSYKDYV